MLHLCWCVPVVHGNLIWSRTLILLGCWLACNRNLLLCFLASDQSMTSRLLALLAIKRRYWKRPALKSLVSLLFASPDRVTPFICCVTLSMVNEWQFGLGMQIMGDDKKQKINPPRCQILSTQLGPSVPWLLSFHYFLTKQNKSAQSCAQLHPIFSSMQQMTLLTFLVQGMMFSTGDGTQRLVHRPKFALCFGTKSIHSKQCQWALIQSICCGRSIS